jgi:hypothetical protein
LKFYNEFESLKAAFLAKNPNGTFGTSSIIGSVNVQFNAGGKVYTYQKNVLAAKLNVAML